MTERREGRPDQQADTESVPENIEQTLEQNEIEQARSKERSTADPSAPPAVPGYEVRSRLGGGAYGEVWLAYQKNTGREVAIKFFSRHKGLDWPLLKREVGKLVQVISERRIVHLLEVGWDAEPPYYVMEYLEGGTLADRLGDKPLPPNDAVRLFRELAESLVYLHSKAILHCDLKPSNVLLDDRDQIRLADFGQARLSSERGPAVGTLFYMAPEQTEPNARPDVRSDIYSLGALLYTMLTGTPPYATAEASRELASTGSTSERIERYRQLIHDSPPPLAHRQIEGVDRGLAEIIDRCLCIDPSERFENVQQVLDVLDARERHRAQRPLVAFGLLGPLALLAAMVAVGVWAWTEAEAGAQETLIRATLEGNLGTARVIAAVVDRNLSAVQRRVAREAGQVELRRLMTAEATGGETEKSRLRSELQAHMDRLHEDYKDRHFHNWVVTDHDGVVLARGPFDDRVVGSRYAYREWFTGLPEQKPEETPVASPRSEVGLTLAFQSTAQGQPILISVASPIRSSTDGDDSGEILGVLSATLHLRTFHKWLETSEGHPTADGCPARMAILVNRHQLVRHPCPAGDAPQPPVPREHFFDTEEVQKLLAETDGTLSEYRDPLRPGGAYLAAFSRLETNSDWIAIVEHNRSEAVAPVTELTGKLSRIGWVAVATGLVGVGVLWVLLFRVSRDRGFSFHSKTAAPLVSNIEE